MNKFFAKNPEILKFEVLPTKKGRKKKSREVPGLAH
jgi:hypothetical protein